MTELTLKSEYGVGFTPRSVGHVEAAGFGVASLGTVIFIITPQILLLYFLTSVIGVPPAIAGFAILIPKLLEIVFDIGIGARSDRTRGRFGRRLGFMIVGGLAFPVLFATMFAPPFAGWQASLAWVMAASLLATFAYTTFSIPYIAMASEISDDPAMLVRVSAWRMAFVAVGVLVAGGVAPMLVDWFGGARTGYAAMGAAVAVVAGVSALAALPVAWRHRASHAPPSPSPIAATLRSIWASASYRRLWTSYAAQMVAISLNAVLLPFALVHQIGVGVDTAGLVFVAMTLATLAAMPISVMLAARSGAATTYALSLLVSAAGVGLMFFARDGVALLILAAIVLGIGQAGATSLPFALMPQASALDDERAARADAGVFTAVWVAGEKLGLSLGGALAGFLLGVVGFKGGGAIESAGAVAAIPWLFGVLPMAVLVAAIAPLAALRGGELDRRSVA